MLRGECRQPLLPITAEYVTARGGIEAKTVTGA